MILNLILTKINDVLIDCINHYLEIVNKQFSTNITAERVAQEREANKNESDLPANIE